jgi:hypothetical protein
MSLVTVGVYDTEIEASLVQAHLEQEGIFCVVANTQYHTVARGFSPSVPGFQGVWVQVRDEDVERAKELIDTAPEPVSEADLAAAAEASSDERV